MKIQTMVLGALAAASLHAQVYERSATMRRNGDPNTGKCTVEVVVDGAAQVEIRGDRALLQNLRGRPPEWRRFECTAPLPPNPGDFRFQGIDGRGRQSLLRDPRNNRGAALVLIEDPDNGAEGYTFDILWSAGGSFDPGRDGAGYPPSYPPAYPPSYPPAYPPAGRQPYPPDDRNARLFDRVRADLGDALSSTRDRRDDYRLDRVYQELAELQRDYGRGGRLDRRELDDVIETLQRVVRDNRLNRRDRDNLNDDLNQLRRLRDRR